MFHVKVRRNRERGSTWNCPLGAVQVAVVCLMLITLKPKSSRLLKIFYAGLLEEGDRLLL
jgi:hypothetical protein